jgi:hypothetical protein
MSLEMPRYFFNLKTEKSMIRDFEGMELPDESSARDHAHIVARELMRNRNPLTTRLWRLSVCDSRSTLHFEVLFASLNRDFSHLPPEMRASIEDVCKKTVSLNDAIGQVRHTLRQVRGTIARSERAPYLAAMDGAEL